MITVAMTATRRPEILQRTLDSFWDNAFMHSAQKFKIRINIDPVGHDISSYEVLDVVRKYPWIDIEYNMPVKPSFPLAFVWAMDHDDSAMTFMLEEDWELLRPLDIDAMCAILDAIPSLALLRLPIFKSANDSMKNWSTLYPWNGLYFECPHEHRRGLGFCGHPSMIKTRFLVDTVPLVDPLRNPEKQYHYGSRTDLLNLVLQWKYGVWGHPNDGPYIKDIGREWMVANGFSKGEDKAHFTQWRKIQNN